MVEVRKTYSSRPGQPSPPLTYVLKGSVTLSFPLAVHS